MTQHFDIANLTSVVNLDLRSSILAKRLPAMVVTHPLSIRQLITMLSKVLVLSTLTGTTGNSLLLRSNNKLYEFTCSVFFLSKSFSATVFLALGHSK